MKKTVAILIAGTAMLAGCANIGNDEKGDASSSNTINSHNPIDNSQHGITECSKGSSLECTQDGNQWVSNEVCKGPSGDTVFLNGPNFSEDRPTECSFESEEDASNEDGDSSDEEESSSSVDSGFSFDD